MNIDFATQQIFEFTNERLKGNCKSILDVGAGNGELAWCLKQSGYRVTALEPNSKHHPQIQRYELDFVARPIEELSSMEFDSILFIRSLHHVDDLFKALSTSANMLNQDGILIVDDFDLARMDQRTAQWVAATTRKLVEQEMLEINDDFDTSTIGQLLHCQDPMEPWIESRSSVHPAGDMIAEIEKHFTSESTTYGPYLYRYFCQHVKDNFQNHQVLQELLEQELECISQKTINAIGLRIVAKKS